jgi:hypothetical protein
MMHNLDEFRSGMRHLVGGSLIALVSGTATAGLLWLSWQTPSSSDAAFLVGFATFTTFTSYYMVAHSLSAGDKLFNIYRSLYSRAEELRLDNMRLRKRLMWQAQQRRTEGEADGAGGTVPSANVRFLVPPKRVN